MPPTDTDIEVLRDRIRRLNRYLAANSFALQSLIEFLVESAIIDRARLAAFLSERHDALAGHAEAEKTLAWMIGALSPPDGRPPDVRPLLRVIEGDLGKPTDNEPKSDQ